MSMVPAETLLKGEGNLDTGTNYMTPQYTLLVVATSKVTLVVQVGGNIYHTWRKRSERSDPNPTKFFSTHILDTFLPFGDVQNSHLNESGLGIFTRQHHARKTLQFAKIIFYMSAVVSLETLLTYNVYRIPATNEWQ